MLIYDGWVVAVGISPKLYLVPRHWPKRNGLSVLLEQLTGCLTAYDVKVLRFPIRFPSGMHCQGRLEGTATSWARRFLRARWRHELVSLLRLQKLDLALPLTVTTEIPRQSWAEIHAVANALQTEFPASMPQFRASLWLTINDWERGWNRAVAKVQEERGFTDEDANSIALMDRQWAMVVREHLEPHGYMMTPDSIARLL